MNERLHRNIMWGIIAFVMFIMGIVVGLGACSFMPPPAFQSTTTTTSTSTSTSTTMESTTTTTTTIETTTSTTTSTTTTLKKFFVCSSELSKTENVETRCFSKNNREWFNTTMQSQVSYVLNDTTFGEYAANRMIIDGDACHYLLKKVSFSVGSFTSCEVPQHRNITVEADLYEG